jgi:hypothetical protein
VNYDLIAIIVLVWVVSSLIAIPGFMEENPFDFQGRSAGIKNIALGLIWPLSITSWLLIQVTVFILNRFIGPLIIGRSDDEGTEY